MGVWTDDGLELGYRTRSRQGLNFFSLSFSPWLFSRHPPHPPRQHNVSGDLMSVCLARRRYFVVAHIHTHTHTHKHRSASRPPASRALFGHRCVRALSKPDRSWRRDGRWSISLVVKTSSRPLSRYVPLSPLVKWSPLSPPYFLSLPLSHSRSSCSPPFFSVFSRPLEDPLLYTQPHTARARVYVCVCPFVSLLYLCIPFQLKGL